MTTDTDNRTAELRAIIDRLKELRPFIVAQMPPNVMRMLDEQKNETLVTCASGEFNQLHLRFAYTEGATAGPDGVIDRSTYFEVLDPSRARLMAGYFDAGPRYKNIGDQLIAEPNRPLADVHMIYWRRGDWERLLFIEQPA